MDKEDLFLSLTHTHRGEYYSALTRRKFCNMQQHELTLYEVSKVVIHRIREWNGGHQGLGKGKMGSY